MGFFSKLKFWGKTDLAKVNAASAVYKIFDQLYAARAPINMTFEHDERSYSSMIIEISKEGNYVLLDELAPDEGNRHMNNKESFNATSSDHGITVLFEAASVKKGSKDGLSYYVVPIPEHVDYQQRRDAFRTAIAMNHKVSITIRNENMTTFHGTIVDMSLTGFKIKFEHNISDSFSKKQILRNAHLHLSTEDHIDINLEIRHIRYEPNVRKTFVGVKMIELTPEAHAHLNHFLSGVQREIRRKQLRD